MKVCVEVYGCALNRSDAAYAIEILKSAGFEITSDLRECDVVIIFTCIVRKDSELRALKRIQELCSLGKKVVVAGCMASALPAKALRACPNAVLVTPRAISEIVRAVKGEAKVVDTEEKTFYKVPTVFEGVKATIAVADGCLDECSFCIVKRARPYLKSAPIEKVVHAIREAIRHGAIEIELTAQDLAVYGYDIHGRYALPELLNEVLSIEGDFRIRLGQMNPRHAINFLDELIEILKDPRVYKHVHVPVQSGNDRILELMNRGHNVELFKEMVMELKRKIEGIHIATDIIVGFPTESEAEFLDSVKLLIELDIDRVHIARYSIRPLTRAASMRQVPEPIKKLRSSYLESIYELVSMNKNLEFVGSIAEGYVVEYDYERSSAVARLHDYRSVVLKGASEKLLGKKIVFKIVDATFYDLRGEILD